MISKRKYREKNQKYESVMYKLGMKINCDETSIHQTSLANEEMSTEIFDAGT